MSRPRKPIELKPGLKLRFVNHLAQETEAVINGNPYVLWQPAMPQEERGMTICRIPVYVPSTSEHIDVAGHNVVGVDKPEPKPRRKRSTT